MRVIIAGSRTILDTDEAAYQRLKEFMYTIPNKPTEIVSGGAKGPDRLGERFAREHGIPVVQFIPEWNNPDGSTNKGAGFIRNGNMAVYASDCPTGGALVAMWDGVSRGTEQMIKVAKQYGVKVKVLQFAGVGLTSIKDVTPKPTYIFPQSHSSLSVFETCPFQYQAKYITREVKWVQSRQAEEGDKAHIALEGFVTSNGAKDLEPPHKPYQQFGEWVLNRAAKHRGQILVERQSAVTHGKRPTTYGDKTGFIRGKIDITILYPHQNRGEVFDWKTNEKVKNDATQLRLYNGFGLTDYPELDSFSSGYIWLKHAQISPPLVTSREELPGVWSIFDHKYAMLRAAYTSGIFPKKPSGLCKQYCDVFSCEHNGRSGA